MDEKNAVPSVPDTGRIKLLIGHCQSEKGWTTLDILEGRHVDTQRTCTDLSHLADASCDAIYISHVLQTLSRTELDKCLKEFYRVLYEGGVLYLSVPDFCYLAHLTLNLDDKDDKVVIHDGFLQRFMFGQQKNAFDFNKIGFTRIMLIGSLCRAGFGYMKEVEDFGMFADSSRLKMNGRRISINVVVEKNEREGVKTPEEQLAEQMQEKAILLDV